MEFPLVSVIVPMYNAQATIRRCVKSICAQTYPSLEILLLNDGSKDDTLRICRELAAADPRIAVIDKPNTGVSDTRNRGLALAHGRYVQFVDSDDWLAPQFTRQLVTAAEQQQADLVITPFWMVYPEDYTDRPRLWEKALSPFLRRNPPKSQVYGFLPAGVYGQQDYLRHLLERPNTFFYNVLWNKLYRRELITTHGIRFPQQTFAEDQRFNAACLPWVNKVVSLDTPGYFYFQTPGSACHAHVSNRDMLALRADMFRTLRSLCRQQGIYRQLRWKVFAAAFGENETTLPPLPECGR